MNLQHLKMTQACLNDEVTSSERTTDKKKWVHDVKINDVLKKEYRRLSLSPPFLSTFLTCSHFFNKKDNLFGVLCKSSKPFIPAPKEHVHDTGGLPYHCLHQHCVWTAARALPVPPLRAFAHYGSSLLPTPQSVPLLTRPGSHKASL